MRHSILSGKKAQLAIYLHRRVPAGWYFDSIHHNMLQKCWHTQRFKQVALVAKKLKGDFLDIGCSDGTFSNVIMCNSNADTIIGVDVLKESIDFAKKKYKENRNMKFQLGEAHNLRFPDNKFDAVFCLEALEHLENPELVLKEMKRVMKKNGTLVILVPNENLLFKFIWFFWTKWRGKIWKGTHLNDFHSSELTDLIKKSGFKVDMEKKFILNMLQLVQARKI